MRLPSEPERDRDRISSTSAEPSLQLRDRAIAAASQGILITDPRQPDNPIVYASPGFERLTGYASAEVQGNNCRFLQGPESDPRAVEHIRRAVHAGEACTVDLLNYRKDGTTFWNELSISPVKDEKGRLTHFIGIQSDITSRRNLEEQLRQSQKMESVGKLAGGIAHDFNNMLTVINGCSELLMANLAATDPSFLLLTEIKNAGERAARLTRQLLTFSRQQVVAPQVADLNRIVADADKLLRGLIGKNIQVEAILSPQPCMIHADVGQIEQVLVNLATNAQNAMPTGGRLTMTTSVVEDSLDDANAGDRQRRDPEVLLCISDTGKGISPEVADRIFDPFFTTSSMGQGTGLGLSVVHGIVAQSGGQIEVQSTVGVGTTFKISFPSTRAPALAENTAPQVTKAPTGSETVLLVDDEHGVRALARTILKRNGYKVLEASTGLEAVALAGEYPDAIDLLMTDMVMPGLGGREVAEQIVAKRPEIGVLFMSGFTDDAVMQDHVRQHQANYLQKPFAPEALARTVREALDKRKVRGAAGG